jgi:type III pantothenate kinase
MLLTIDIGNSNIVLGVFQDKVLIDKFRLRTDTLKTEDEYSIVINELLAPYAVSGAIISSVVPKLNRVFKNFLLKHYNIEPLVIGPGMKTGLAIRLDNPREIGADLVASAVGAISQHEGNIIIIDLGTATKIMAINKTGFLGGAIIPGVQISLEALSEKTALLPYIELEAPKNPIGPGTVPAMASGLVLGTASMVDGMVDRFIEQLGEPATIIATGGFSKKIIPNCKHDIIIDENLISTGLCTLYYKNTNE